jgi:glyoxylase-like metal-dependent hydrolase (beta-lactamase superfamily II)
VFHDGTAELAPGIVLHLLGGHSGGIQALAVETRRGRVVLAGDTTHLWANIRTRNPFPIIADVGKVLDGYNILESLADGPDHIIPGHDPLLLQRFPACNGDPDTVRLDLDPIA